MTSGQEAQSILNLQNNSTNKQLQMSQAQSDQNSMFGGMHRTAAQTPGGFAGGNAHANRPTDSAVAARPRKYNMPNQESELIKVPIANRALTMHGALPVFHWAGHWGFARVFHQCLQAHDYTPESDGTTSNAREEKLRSVVQAALILENLARTVCSICDGYGHSKNVCPTDARLAPLMQFSAVSKSALSRARFGKVVDGAEHLLPDAPLPKCSTRYPTK